MEKLSTSGFIIGWESALDILKEPCSHVLFISSHVVERNDVPFLVSLDIDSTKKMTINEIPENFLNGLVVESKDIFLVSFVELACPNEQCVAAI